MATAVAATVVITRVGFDRLPCARQVVVKEKDGRTQHSGDESPHGGDSVEEPDQRAGGKPGEEMREVA